MKLVINSHVSYGRPLGKYLDSLRKVGFHGEIVIVQGGADQDSRPRRDLSDWFPITWVKTRLNSYDTTGYNVLNRFRRHPSIQAEKYFYTPDTCLAEPTFPKCFKSFLDKPLSESNDAIYSVELPNSFVSVFESGVVDNYGTGYSRPLTKMNIIDIEYGQRVGLTPKRECRVAFRKVQRYAQSLGAYGTVQIVGERTLVGEEDIYGTGMRRRRYVYESFGLSKFILWEYGGDITGEVRKNTDL